MKNQPVAPLPAGLPAAIDTADLWDMLCQCVDGIGMIEPGQTLTYANPALFAIHGIGPDDQAAYIGRDWRNLYTPKGRSYIDNHVLPVLHVHGHWRGQSRILRKDSRVATLDLTLSRLRQGGFFGTARDISAWRELEIVSRMADGAVHDFNNTLGSILGFAEMIRDDATPGSETADFAARIMQAAGGSRVAIEQMEFFSRIRQRSDDDRLLMDNARSVCVRIALVDDQDVVREMVAVMLRRAGFVVDVFTDGVSLLAALKAAAYDVVLADHAMPGFSGFDMARQVGRDHPSIPVIIMSGLPPGRLEALLPECPAVSALLRKPLDRAQTIGLIRAVVHERQAVQAGATA